VRRKGSWKRKKKGYDDLIEKKNLKELEPLRSEVVKKLKKVDDEIEKLNGTRNSKSVSTAGDREEDDNIAGIEK